MRFALQQSIATQKQGVAVPVHVPAPVGGWNTRDSIADMDPLDAPILDNWFPRQSEVVQRGGNVVWSTGMTGIVQSLAAYQSAGGVNKLYGVTNAGIYDITAGGAVGAVVQALTNGYFISLMMENSAGQNFLWGASEADAPVMFDGATWSAPSITGGITTTNIVAPWLFKHRIWFIEKGTMNAWYLGLDSIQGAAAPFPFDIFRLGGALIAGANWTQDAGDGSDDLLAVITSNGELAVYAGIDPTSASSFQLIGVWFVGRPMWRRCFFKLGGDVGVITENGVFPLSKLLQSGNVNYASALSNKIQPSFVAATQAVGVTTLGFEGCVYPAWDALIINIIPPTSQSAAQQFVMNTITGKWCSFSGWTPLCFFVFLGQLYFGAAGGKVYKAWDAAQLLVSDNGSDISATVHTAYNTFGASGRLKQVNLFRPLLAYSGTIDTRWAISPDFTTVRITSFSPRGNSTIGSPWDTSPWDTSSWSPDLQRQKLWKAAAHAPGFALSLWLQTAGNTGILSWAGTDYILKGGAMM